MLCLEKGSYDLRTFGGHVIAAAEKRNPYWNAEYGFLFSVAVFPIQENDVPRLSDSREIRCSRVSTA